MKRALRRFFAYRFLSSAYLFVPAQVAFYQSKGLSFTEILFLNSVFNIVLLLCEIPTGAFADRKGRTVALSLGGALMAAAFVVYAYAPGYLFFILAESLFALGMTLSSGADSAYLFDLLRSEKREGDYSHFEGQASAAKHLGMATAFALGGFLGQYDLRAPFLVSALVVLLAAGLALTLPEPSHSNTGPRPMAEVIRGFREGLMSRRFRHALLYSSLLFVLLRISLWIYQPYLAAAGLALPSTGFAFAGLSLVAALSSRCVGLGRRLLGARGLFVGLPAVMGLSYAVLAFFVSPLGIIALSLQKSVDGLYSPITKDLLNREIASHAPRATLLSAESMARRIAFGLFAPMCGLALDERGLSAGLGLCAGVGLLGVGVALLWRPIAAS